LLAGKANIYHILLNSSYSGSLLLMRSTFIHIVYAP
jgi:hypothetical protein